MPAELSAAAVASDDDGWLMSYDARCRDASTSAIRSIAPAPMAKSYLALILPWRCMPRDERRAMMPMPAVAAGCDASDDAHEFVERAVARC